jgi:UDP-N-acetylglucosamine 2-epimerase (non-hydrolysing)
VHGNEPFLLVTLHRPSNVDDPARLAEIMRTLARISHQLRVIFPVHPRTRQSLDGCFRLSERLLLRESMGYLDFLALESRAAVVLTDSGGIQEETTFLGIPCLTLRPNTERPVTLTHGTNKLVDGQATTLIAALNAVLNRHHSPLAEMPRPALWDGQAAPRIVTALREATG